MTTEKFSLYTATAEELAAHVDEKFRKEQMNFAEKLEKLSDLKFRLTSDGQLMLNWIDFDRRGRTPEVIAAHRRYVQAEVAWLESNPGDDLTPERVAMYVEWAKKEMPHAQELRIAALWCKEVEDWHESEPNKKSDTLLKIERKLSDRVDEIRRHLACALTLGQTELLAEINARTWRTKQRFRVQRTTAAYEELRCYRLIDFELRITKRFLLFASFDRVVSNAKTLSEVKAICGCWHTPFTVERRDGGSFVTGDGFEIIPQL